MVGKPSEREEEYFARMEFQRKKKLEEEKQKKMADGEKKKIKELHYMKCPKCGMELIQIDYKGITVDKCSRCEGIWLDAGELEAISKIEKKVLDKLFDVFKR
jgi:Zn finger protein HypA/HybF involved in hydrogenase expression